MITLNNYPVAYHSYRMGIMVIMVINCAVFAKEMIIQVAGARSCMRTAPAADQLSDTKSWYHQNHPSDKRPF
jgi:hypothetical protein